MTKSKKQLEEEAKIGRTIKADVDKGLREQQRRAHNGSLNSKQK